MKYPKQIMKITELIEMGFPRQFLLRAYLSRGQNFAQKMDPLKKKSPIVFDTEGFEAWRSEQQRIEVSALRR
jgi:hypothetical protein